jgi:hypothetical protein
MSKFMLFEVGSELDGAKINRTLDLSRGVILNICSSLELTHDFSSSDFFPSVLLDVCFFLIYLESYEN